MDRAKGAPPAFEPPHASLFPHDAASGMYTSNGLVPLGQLYPPSWHTPAGGATAHGLSGAPPGIGVPYSHSAHSQTTEVEPRMTGTRTEYQGYSRRGPSMHSGAPPRVDIAAPQSYYNGTTPEVFSPSFETVTAGIERLLTSSQDPYEQTSGLESSGTVSSLGMHAQGPPRGYAPQPPLREYVHTRETVGMRFAPGYPESYEAYPPAADRRRMYGAQPRPPGPYDYMAPMQHSMIPQQSLAAPQHSRMPPAHSHPPYYGGVEEVDHYHQLHGPEDEMAMAALAMAANFSPDSVHEFRQQQLDLMRKLLVRRLFLLTRRSEHYRLSQYNVRVALHVFSLPLIVYDLISRPLRGTAVPGAFPSRRQLVDYLSNPSFSSMPGRPGGVTAIDLIPAGEEQDISVFSPPVDRGIDLSGGVSDVDGSLDTKSSPAPSLESPQTDSVLSHVMETPIPDSCSLTDADGMGLPEDALGWWPAGLSVPELLKNAQATGAEPAKHGGLAQFGRVEHGISTADGEAIRVDPAWERSLAVAVVGALTADLIARKRFRTKFCHSWMRTGSCPRGNGCDYAHGQHELRSSSESRDSRYRTRLCRTWMSTCGTYCPHADKCAFAHGVQQLRLRLPDADEDVHQLVANAVSAVEALSTASRAASHDAEASSTTETSSSAGVAPIAGSAPVPQGLRKFKGSLCRAWLQGATQGALIAGFKLVRDKSEEVSTLRFDAARAGAQRCPHGDACPHAHGLSELRLPAVMEQVRLVEALANEGPYARAGLSGEDAGDGSVPLRDLTLILIASALLTTNLPLYLVPRVAAVASLLGSNAQLPLSGVFPDFDGLPPAFAKALSASLVNPMLQVVLPYTASDRPGGGRKSDGMDLPPGHRVGLAKIISAVGNESADTAILAGAIAMGGVAFSLPLHLVSEGDVERDKGLPASGSSATGRYGVLLRRRIEIQAALQELVRLKSQRVSPEMALSRTPSPAVYLPPQAPGGVAAPRPWLHQQRGAAPYHADPHSRPPSSTSFVPRNVW